MSGLEVAASIPALVSVARKAAAGISKVSGLRQAPDVLLALNNEIADLQCVIVSHSVGTGQVADLDEHSTCLGGYWRA